MAMFVKCALCVNEFEFDFSWLCPGCNEKVIKAEERGKEAIKAAVAFNRRDIGFAELKQALSEIGVIRYEE